MLGIKFAKAQQKTSSIETEGPGLSILEIKPAFETAQVLPLGRCDAGHNGIRSGRR